MLVPFREILKDAYLHQYAVGAFNCLSLENVMGAIRAAEELRSPVIIQLAEVQFPYSPIVLMAPLYLEAARRATVPVAVHLDHGQSFNTCALAIKLGFGSVMFDGASLPFASNVQITREVVAMAKAFDVDVEAELGRVGDTTAGEGEGTGIATPDIFTDVEESASFLASTGVDALAIAIGNLHGNYVATPQLNISRLKEINIKNRIPLVLHGGTGTSENDFKSCIRNGICKINVATAIQMHVAKRIAAYAVSSSSPNYIEIKNLMTEASREAVADHILLFESNGRV